MFGPATLSPALQPVAQIQFGSCHEHIAALQMSPRARDLQHRQSFLERVNTSSYRQDRDHDQNIGQEHHA